MAQSNKRPARPRRASAVPREVLKSIDNTERKASFFLAGLGGVFSLYLLYIAVFVGQQTTVVTAKYDKTKGCAAGYKLVKGLCSQTQITTVSAVWFEFALVAVTSLALFGFSWRRNRTGTVFVSLFEGLALGLFSIGLPYVILGAWLLWRAYRLQKYGVATFAGVSEITRERAQARKEGREIEPLTLSAPPPDPSAPRTPAEPSKRYTPKKTPKKR